MVTALFHLAEDPLPHVLTCSFLGHLHVCVLIFSYKDISHTGLEPTHMPFIYLNYLCKCPISKQSHVPRHWRLGKGDKIQLMTETWAIGQ